MHVPSVHSTAWNKLCSHRNDFYDIWYLSFFRDICRENSSLCKCDKNNGYLTWRLYLLTPWCRFFLQNLTGFQLVKKIPAFHGTRRFITALTSVCHLSLSWASPIHSIYPHPTSWRSILILSTHLCLGLPSGLLPSGFPTKTLYFTWRPTYLNDYIPIISS